MLLLETICQTDVLDNFNGISIKEKSIDFL